MANDTSPSTNTEGFTTPKKSSAMTAIADFASQYWWVIAIVVVVVGYLLYQRMQSSSAQVGSTAGVQGDTSGVPSGNVSATQPDMSNLIDMLSTQYQDLSNRMGAWSPPNGNVTAGTLPPSPSPGPHGQPAILGTNNPVFNRPGIRGAKLAVGGVPPSGQVPFGTHVAMHAPMMSTGAVHSR